LLPAQPTSSPLPYTTLFRSGDIIGRIFEPLVTTKRGQGGTGLGLAITRRILTANEGEISVESTPGAGAEFTITLPKMDGAPPSRSEEHTSELQSRSELVCRL